MVVAAVTASHVMVEFLIFCVWLDAINHTSIIVQNPFILRTTPTIYSFVKVVLPVGMRLNEMTKVGALVAALVLGLATGAQALTIQYDTRVSGPDWGPKNVATLELTQNGNDVTFLLTNTLTDYMNSFIKSLGLDYTGSNSRLQFGNSSGVLAKDIEWDSTPSKGNPFNVVVDYNSSNKNNGALRLNPTETSQFTILNVRVEDFNFATGASQIHIGGASGGNGSKFTTAEPMPAAVPLPAAGLVLLGGLASLAGLRRRSRTA